jgi:hypothetical protein
VRGADEDTVKGEVCLDEVRERQQQVTRLPCSHKYHSECVLPWLAIHRSWPRPRRAPALHRGGSVGRRRRRGRYAVPKWSRSSGGVVVPPSRGPHHCAALMAGRCAPHARCLLVRTNGDGSTDGGDEAGGHDGGGVRMSMPLAGLVTCMLSAGARSELRSSTDTSFVYDKELCDREEATFTSHDVECSRMGSRGGRRGASCKATTRAQREDYFSVYDRRGHMQIEA